MLAEYDDQHPGTHRFPPFRLADVKSDGWANLRSLAIKAANTRAADSASRGLCHRWFDRATLSDNSQRFVIDALREVYEKLCKEPMFVSDGGGHPAARGEHPAGCLEDVFGLHALSLRHLFTRVSQHTTVPACFEKCCGGGDHEQLT